MVVILFHIRLRNFHESSDVSHVASLAKDLKSSSKFGLLLRLRSSLLLVHRSHVIIVSLEHLLQELFQVRLLGRFLEFRFQYS